MKIGVQLPEVEREVRWPELVAMAQAAEETGFDSVWLGDHLLYRGDGRPERGPWDCWTMLAGLAAVTERVELGPLVACTAFRPAGLLARAAAAVDELSGGRLRVGLGSGWNETEFRAFGVPFDHRVARFEEAFAIVRGLLAGERVTVTGSHWQADDAVLLPGPARRTPLMIGSNGPRVLRATLPHVDAWNTWWDGYGNTVDGFAKLNATIDDAARSAGRGPAEIDRSVCVLVEVGAGAGERRPADDLRPVPSDPEALAPHLHGLAAAGADEAILVLDPITEASVRALAPALAAIDA
jgi:alkanesulfonate monooxygenase SsuD/methylene tetrahydromethanopterin reductase-like flavin-dependent oxidoreductase (luciferase family)